MRLWTYRTIAEDVQRRIQLGEYPPGSKIPSYSGLARLYGVSVATAQRAVRVLRLDGTAFGMQGRGVFVSRKRRKSPARERS
jgi:GntR family transcriptional regulator